MKRWARLLLITALAFATPLQAQVADADRQAIAARIAALHSLMTDQNLDGWLETIPPRILEALIEEFGDAASLEADLRQTMAEAYAQITLKSLVVDLDAATVTETADGLPYGLLPTVVEFEVDDVGTIRIEEDTLAIRDGGAWYLVRASESDIAVLFRQLYPEFSEVDLPEVSVTVEE